MRDAALAVVWGKSKAQGSMHLLLGHLLDTAAVGELVWDRFLSPAVRDRLDACSGGRGRSLFALVCGLHDVGKATPAFQMKDDGLAERVRAVGLDWRGLTRDQARGWHHARAGAAIVRDCLQEAGWARPACGWVWPLVAGHHGSVPEVAAIRLGGNAAAHGKGLWGEVQRGFVERVAGELGLDLSSFADVGTPSRGVQLAVSGLVIMADWIASDEEHFGGLSELSEVSLEGARERARKAWERLGLCGGWRGDRPAPLGRPDLVRHRFGVAARPAQADAVRLAEAMPAPGLLILEAPMGEGKTEAALAVVEVLARRFGADGVFVGMPTQATSDPMFGRVRTWLASVDPDVPIGLLHGRSRFNREWAALRSHVSFAGVGDDLDDYGMGDDYGVLGSRAGAGSGSGVDDRQTVDGVAAAEWFLGAKRGLLAPVTVGTVDQLLHAATRTKHVMLRHAGLAGRVVVLDEVHAYDVYMSQFLFEALRWLADAGVPVVLLSATLPPPLRQKLVRAYLQGATQDRDVDVADVPEPAGYPSTTAVCTVGGRRYAEVESAPSWRASEPVRVAVEVLEETPEFDPATVAAAVVGEMGAGGGCALVVCNTVARAQGVYRALRPVFGADVVLLHARFTAAERAARTGRIVDLLGRPGREDGAPRPQPPRPLVVVATQVAEQSFDVDVDLLFSDLAPIDLLLQRVGRLHRHDRPVSARPPRLRRPKVIVSGLLLRAGEAPRWPGGSRAVYGDHLLLRSAALVAEAAAGVGWSVPEQVPSLVADGYCDAPLGPREWAEAAARYRTEWTQREQRREAKAREFLLSGEECLNLPTLDGLHERSAAPLKDEEEVAAVVRDGEESAEVVLVRRGQAGAGYLTLGGRSLGPNGDLAADDGSLLEEVVGATIRLPANKDITAAARAELAPLPGWRHEPWLRRTRALVLDDERSAALGGYRLTYNDETGLSHAREGNR
jgi:CRISPR-associated endonuclease/helicase Cas3